jgi:hypothetical protein
LPEQWFLAEQYARRGSRLPGATGAVYRVDTGVPDGERLTLVVKFSRFAQDLDQALAALLHGAGRESVFGAQWNDPFEELGVLAELRRARRAGAPRVLTKRPLAIYCPPGEHRRWQLARSGTLLAGARERLGRDQRDHGDAGPVHLHELRQYVLLYEWVQGLDAEQWHQAGALSQAEMESLNARVAHELALNGFRVLDHKPRHIILRQRRATDELLRRRGELVYALVDFELLQRESQS